MLKIILIFFLLNTFFLFQVYSQSTDSGAESNANIQGQVIDAATQTPLPGITVRVLGTNFGAITKAEGKFLIKNVPFGIYSIQFSGIGHETYVESSFPVAAGKPINLLVKMIDKVIELEGTEVRASYFQKQIEASTSTNSLSALEIRRTPGIQEDVIQAASLLPGVGVAAAGRNDLLVRGGAPYENLFIVDNVEVPNINHFGSQGVSGGPLSIINIDLIRNVDFATGGFSPNYGDKLSSFTNITLKDGNNERLSGILNLSATGFSAILEGPVTENSSFFVAAKRSYLDLLFTLAGFGFIPQYWDFQAKYSLKVDDKNSFSVLALGALDDVKLNNEDVDKLYTNSQVAVPDQKQYFIGATWKRLYNNGYSTITFGRSFINFKTFQNDSLGNMIFKNFSNEGENTLKADCDLQIAPKMSIYFGNQFKFASALDYDVVVPGYLRKDQNGVPQGLQVDTSFTAIRNATYFNLTASMMDHFKYSVGARIDYYNYTSNQLNISPRLSATYQINPVSAIIMSLGRYVQAPSYIWLVGGSTSELNPLKSDLAVLGYQHTPLEDVKVQLELYYKKYWNYPARVYRPQAVLAPSGFDDATSDIPFGLEPLLSSATGLSRGIELLVQKKLSDIPIYGILSLSYSQTEFTSIEGKERTGAFDSRFIGNLSFGWRLSRDWEISSRFRIATGLPTTPFKADLSGELDFTRYNEGERLPLFNSLDLRIDKRWFFQSTSLITYIDIQNIYSRQNISGYRWDYRTNSPEAQESIGILPSIGITLEF